MPSPHAWRIRAAKQVSRPWTEEHDDVAAVQSYPGRSHELCWIRKEGSDAHYFGVGNVHNVQGRVAQLGLRLVVQDEEGTEMTVPNKEGTHNTVWLCIVLIQLLTHFLAVFQFLHSHSMYASSRSC